MELPESQVIPENPNQENETPTTRNVNFIINDGETAIQGAVVTIGEITGTTGSAGGCTLHNVSDGEQSVNVTADGFISKTETITVSESNTTFTISLEAE
jgi:hypothetical protein